MARQHWASRTVFVLAAVGSAVGLGNVWRFPYLAAKHGGGAFLVPYLIALVIVGIPLLALEIGVGQTKQQGVIGSFRKLLPSFGGLGIFALITAFVIVSYYAVVIAWSLIYLLGSFDMEWSNNPEAYFNDQVLQVSEGLGEIGTINWPIFLSLIVVWVLIYFSVWQGTKSVGKIVLYSVPLPILLLVCLFIRAITLPGFLDGWAMYLVPNVEALRNPQVWIDAFGQIFFTLTLSFGVMITYASYRDRGEDIVQDTWITALINSAISIFAGFVVFGILGYMATQTEQSLEALAQANGPGLAFVVFPEALSLMPLSEIFSLLFFIMLFTLGIDSAFSLVESVNTAFTDQFENIKTSKLSLWVCLLGFLAGMIYTTQGGLYLLGTVDNFALNYNLILVGIMECILVGWLYGAEKLRREINEVSNWKLGKWWNITIQYVIIIVLTALLITQIYGDFIQPEESPSPWEIGISLLVILVPFLIFVGFVWKDQKQLKETS